MPAATSSGGCPWPAPDSARRSSWRTARPRPPPRRRARSPTPGAATTGLAPPVCGARRALPSAPWPITVPWSWSSASSPGSQAAQGDVPVGFGGGAAQRDPASRSAEKGLPQGRPRQHQLPGVTPSWRAAFRRSPIAASARPTSTCPRTPSLAAASTSASGVGRRTPAGGGAERVAGQRTYSPPSASSARTATAGRAGASPPRPGRSWPAGHAIGMRRVSSSSPPPPAGGPLPRPG